METNQYEPNLCNDVSLAVVEEVAAASNVPPLALPPLYDAIDPELLDSLVPDSGANRRSGFEAIQFTYAGYEVDVARDGVVTVTAETDR